MSAQNEYQCISRNFKTESLTPGLKISYFQKLEWLPRFFNKVGYSGCAPMYRKRLLLSKDRTNPHITSRIIEAREPSDTIYLC